MTFLVLRVPKTAEEMKECDIYVLQTLHMVAIGDVKSAFSFDSLVQVGRPEMGLDLTTNIKAHQESLAREFA